MADKRQKQYDNFVDMVRKAYPEMRKTDVFKKAQTMWKSVKTDQEKYETIILLKSKAAKQASKDLFGESYFACNPLQH